MSKGTLSFVAGALAGGAAAAVAIKSIGRRREFVLDRAWLPDAIPHVVYEYSNLIHSADYVAYESKGGPIGVHVGDVFLLNCRKLADFFSTKANHHGDVRAEHFCSANPLPKIPMKHYRRWHRAINKNLAHISYGRVTNPLPIYDGDITKVVQLVEEARYAFRLFLSHVDGEYAPTFQIELKERSAVVGKALP